MKKLYLSAWPDYAKLKPVLFEMPTYKYLRTGAIIGDCVKMGKAVFQREKSDVLLLET